MSENPYKAPGAVCENSPNPRWQSVCYTLEYVSERAAIDGVMLAVFCLAPLVMVAIVSEFVALSVASALALVLGIHSIWVFYATRQSRNKSRRDGLPQSRAGSFERELCDNFFLPLYVIVGCYERNPAEHILRWLIIACSFVVSSAGAEALQKWLGRSGEDLWYATIVSFCAMLVLLSFSLMSYLLSIRRLNYDRRKQRS